MAESTQTTKGKRTTSPKNPRTQKKDAAANGDQQEEFHGPTDKLEIPPNEQENLVDNPEVREALLADFNELLSLRDERISLNAVVDARRKAIYARSINREALAFVTKLNDMDEPQRAATWAAVRLLCSSISLPIQLGLFESPESSTKH